MKVLQLKVVCSQKQQKIILKQLKRVLTLFHRSFILEENL